MFFLFIDQIQPKYSKKLSVCMGGMHVCKEDSQAASCFRSYMDEHPINIIFGNPFMNEHFPQEKNEAAI